MYSGGEVASCGNSRLSAWKRTKDRCYLRSRSHTWDMRWHIGFSSAHPRFSGVVVLWQRATEANCVECSQTENLHGPLFVCLFSIVVFWVFFSLLDPLLSSLDWSLIFFFLLFTYAETQPKRCLPAACYSVFHHFLIILLFFFPLSEGLSLNLKLVFHPNCVKLVRYAVNNAGIAGKSGLE